MTTKRYTTINRPPGYATLPRLNWTLTERGTGGYFPKREDLPVGTTKFGVFGFDRDLSAKEISDFELLEVAALEPMTQTDYANALASATGAVSVTVTDITKNTRGEVTKSETATSVRPVQVGDKLYTASAFSFGDLPGDVHVSEFTVKSVKTLVTLVQKDLTQVTRVPVKAVRARYASSPAEAVLRLEKHIDEEVLKAKKRKALVSSWLADNLTDANYLAALAALKAAEGK